jgi:predicted MFS family arabinose efflux permease
MQRLLSNRVFRLVMVSDLLQHTAIWIRNMALLFFVMERTGGDPVAVALLTVAEYVPIFVFSVIGGVLADRWNPKRTMIVGDLMSAASVGVILWLLTKGWWEAIYVATFVSAVVSQFSQPSSARIFKKHVPDGDVSAAVGLSQSLISLFLIGGPVLGTWVYQSFGLFFSLKAILCLFLISAWILTLLPHDRGRQDRGETSLSFELVAGLRFIRSNNVLVRLMIAFAVIGAGVGLIQPLEVFIVTNRLGLPKEVVQWFHAAEGMGMLLGGALGAVFASRMEGRVMLSVGILFLSLSAVGEALSVWPLLTWCFRFTGGFFLAFINISVGTFIIRQIPEAMVGRVNGLVTPIFTGTLLVGSALSGWLMVWIGLIPVMLAAAAVIALALFPSAGVRVGAHLEETSVASPQTRSE